MAGGMRPPGLARLLARILLPGDIRDEMEGDLLEGHANRVARVGKTRADRWYWRQVLSLRPTVLRKALRRKRAQERRPAPGGWSTGGWESDLKHGWRYLRRRPGASLTVTGTIALVVAATTIVFSIVNGVLLRPLPYPESEQLVSLFRSDREWAESPNEVLRAWAAKLPVPVSTFDEWQAESREFAALGGYTREDGYTFRGSDGLEFVRVAGVTQGLFEVLGIRPALGVGFTRDDHHLGADAVVVLSHRSWMTRFGGDPSILGRPLALGPTSFTVVGVMPAGFAFPTPEEEFWIPLNASVDGEDGTAVRIYPIGRLRHGGSLEAARAEMEATRARLEEAFPEDRGRYGVRLVPMLESVVEGIETTLWFLLGSVLLALLVACVNVVNILTVLGLGRRQETALKAALGAGRGRLVRGQLLESVILAGAGGLAGLALSALILPALVAMLPADIPRQENVGIDPLVLASCAGLTLITAILVGLYPAVQAGLAHPGSLLAGSGRGQTGGRRVGRAQRLFVIGEVATAVVLLVGAGLLGNSFLRLRTVERGFATEGVVTMSIAPDENLYPEQEDRDRLLQDLRAELSSIPNLAITAANVVPLSRSTSIRGYFLEDARTEERVPLVFNVVLEDYFRVMRIPLVEGRGFDDRDVRQAPLVAVVNEAAAQAFWPGRSAVGRRLRRYEDDPWITVVGVARDVRHQSLSVDPEPHIYLPADQSDVFPTEWVARAQGGVSSVPALLRAGLGVVSPQTPVRRMYTLEEEISRSLAIPRLRTLFVCGLAGVSALLVLLGVYGIVSFSVSRRTREIGIRMAVGSDPHQAVRQVLRSGFAPPLVGLILGLLIAFPSAALVSGFLFHIQPTDPMTFLATAVLVGLVSLGAVYLPARKAARVDPMAVLKVE